MQQLSSIVSVVGIECGREDRSRSPAMPSQACRAIHLYAVRRLMPRVRATTATGLPTRIRSIRRARLAGQLRAPLCRFIRGSWLRVDGVRHQSTSTDRPRVINYPCEQPPWTSHLERGKELEQRGALGAGELLEPLARARSLPAVQVDRLLDRRCRAVMEELRAEPQPH